MDNFLVKLGEEVQDTYEETFDLFSQASALPNLGMVNPQANELELSIAGRDFTILQSPGLLQSKEKYGTTGAAVWQTSVHLAEWMAEPKNVLFRDGVLDSSSTVLELGSGVSSVVASTVATRVRQVIATDQQHMLKLLQANLEANAAAPSRGSSRNGRTAVQNAPGQKVRTLALDWEEDDIQKHLTSHDLGGGVDLVLACDCIYNYALIEPFVEACASICHLRRREDDVREAGTTATVCLVAQQLRASDVFEQWLDKMLESFRVWRIPSKLLNAGLKEGGGFMVHIAILR